MLISALVLVHVLSAFAYVSGYVATAGLTEISRRRSDLQELRTFLTLSGMFDRLLVRNGGTVVGLSGIALIVAGNASWSSPWIWLATLLFAAIVAVGIGIWGPYGGRVEAALAASDQATVVGLLRERRWVVLSRVENVALLAVIVLMVIRPA